MRKFFVLLLVLAMLPVLSMAQAKGGDIYGTLVLADGSRIPGVLVTLSGSFGKKTTITSDQGNFRFLGVDPGNYEVKCELQGFKSTVQKNIELALGKTVTLNLLMETTTLEEEVVVMGKANIIDVRKTTIGVNVSKEMKDSIPNARNPWTVLSAVPGIVLDRVDIGGADSGQQSNFMAGGGDGQDTTWNVDGANITDPSAIGSSPAYLNINSYGEVQVTMGANDITAQTGGVQLNFVGKRAGNETTGDFHIYVEDKAWEMTQDIQPGMVVIPGVNRLYQYGVGLGGAIIKDKLWWFGTWGIQDIHKRKKDNIEDATWLAGGYAKLNFQFGNTSGDFHLSYDNKQKWGRTVVATQDNGSLWDQYGPGYTYYGGLSHVFGDLMLNVKMVYTDGGFALDPRGANINSANNHNEGADAVILDGWSAVLGSFYHYNTDRNSLDVSMDGNYFAENVLGGDHEIKFGVDYYTASTTSQQRWSNQRALYMYTDGSDSYLQIAPDYMSSVGFNRISFYAQDTVSFGKLTASLGLRYDKEQGKVKPYVSPFFTWYEPGSPYHDTRMFADQISALNIAATKVAVAWKHFSPRLSLTYDITGNGKNIIKLSAGRYMSQSGNSMAAGYAPYRYGFANWTDANGDGTPQYNEVGELYNDALFLIVDPVTNVNNIAFDPDYNTPILTEVTLAFEKSLSDDLAASVTGFYKKKTNLSQTYSSRGRVVSVTKGIMADGSIETKNNWHQIGDITVGGTVVPRFEQIEYPTGIYFHNLTEGNQEYLGAQFRLTKNLSNKWMADLSFTISDWKQKRVASETLNMNNFNFFDGGQVAPNTTGSGINDIFVNSNWMVKFSGMYQLPLGINITTLFQAKQGGPQPFRRSWNSAQGPEYSYMLGHKLGDQRLPTFWMLNMGLEKNFKIGNTVNAAIVIDWYNATNNQLVLQERVNIGAAPVQSLVPTEWMNAGLFQFGVRVNF